MSSLGHTIKKLREEQHLPLRTVAAFLDIDQAILSKYERGLRKPTRHQVVQLAAYFKVKENDLLVHWLSDKLVYELKDEDEDKGLKALQMAEEKVAYKAFRKIDRKHVVKQLVEGIQRFSLIEKAWLYGSFSRKDDGPASDIDIALKTDSAFSYFDMAEVQFELEKLVKRKVDVGFIDSFKPYILEHVQPDLKLFYERSA